MLERSEASYIFYIFEVFSFYQAVACVIAAFTSCLLQELCKYTWKHHPDYVSAKSAYEAMQVVCSVINEAKRRSEKLEAVHDWQQSVDGFEVGIHIWLKMHLG